MIGMFYGANAFNGDLSKWRVSSVTAMSGMFNGAKAFDGDISKWDVSNVADMSGVFSGASKFNGDLSNWRVSSVIDMSDMFRNAEAFNGDISKWDVSRVIDMADMFTNAQAFNGDISKWDVSRITSTLNIKGATGLENAGKLKWTVLSDDAMGGKSSAQLSFVPGPEGGFRLAGTISLNSRDGQTSAEGGFASCRTIINQDTPLLGFSDHTVSLRLEVTGDGQRYKVALREKEWGVKAPVWQAEFDTKAGQRTVVVLPLNKATWHETMGGDSVAHGGLPVWAHLRGMALVRSSKDVKGKPADPAQFRGDGPFEITVHSMQFDNNYSHNF